MSSVPGNPALEDERTAEKQYVKQLREKASRPVTCDGPRNLRWTGDGLPAQRPVAIGPLVGRVALMRPDEMLGNRNDFYIGEGQSANVDGIEVACDHLSWPQLGRFSSRILAPLGW